MRLVLDTSVIVSAVRSPAGAAAEIVQSGLSGQFDWLISVPLSLEYEDVLCRREHLLVSGYTVHQVQTLVDMVILRATKIILDPPTDLHLPDPNDLHVHRLALTGNADAVVTYNLRHFASLPAQFGVNLYTPVQVLQILRGDEHEQEL